MARCTRSHKPAPMPVERRTGICWCLKSSSVSPSTLERVGRTLGFGSAPNLNKQFLCLERKSHADSFSSCSSPFVQHALVGAEPFVGMWKLNVEKSKLTSSNADLAGRTMTISQTGPNTFVSIVDSVSKSGETRHQKTTRIYDGKERPFTGGQTAGHHRDCPDG